MTDNKTNNTGPAKRGFEDIGRDEALRQLFEGSGYINSDNIVCPGEGEMAHVVMLEGIDFDLVYTPLKHLGFKAVTAVAGTLFSRLCNPGQLSVVLGVSAKLFFDDIQQLWQGCLAGAQQYGFSSIRLELAPSMTGLCISLTGFGQKAIKDSPAPKSMDLVCISGNLGAAYMGLHVLEREKAAFTGTGEKQPDLQRYKYIVGEYLTPRLRDDVLKQMTEFGITPSYGLFLRHPLAEATARIIEGTGLGIKIYVSRIPIAEETFAMSEEIRIDAVTAALNGGDDYRLLFTVPITQHDVLKREFPDFDIIGHLAVPEAGRTLVTPDGAELNIH